jgi:glycosidase
MGVQALGMGLGTLIRELGVRPEIVTGHDFRGYSASVKTSLISGLLAAGCKVHDIGLAVTPMAYFAQFELDVPCVAMVTADRPRVASRVGPNQARIAAMLLLSLRGTPTVYYGDEIAMPQVTIAPDQVRDPLGKNVPGRGLGRDGCRTPMRWDSTTHAGFSTAEPWLPLGDRFDKDSAADQRRDRHPSFTSTVA